MKDYKLSEIKTICEKHKYCNDKCPFYTEAYVGAICLLMTSLCAPEKWQIDKEGQDDE